jgi:crotonobetainyl-CoA:carnitine CoA-transferase CaiB-like acyl-CoA transferase
MAEATALPLAGYRALELAHLVSGLVWVMYVADMGGRPSRSESPHGGDASRSIFTATYRR